MCQKGVAHLVKAIKTGQKTGLYFSQEQVQSYRTKMEVKNKYEIMIKMRYLFLVQNSNLVENSLYHFSPENSNLVGISTVYLTTLAEW